MILKAVFTAAGAVQRSGLNVQEGDEVSGLLAKTPWGTPVLTRCELKDGRQINDVHVRLPGEEDPEDTTAVLVV